MAFNKLAVCERAIGQIVNVGGQKEISILDLAFRVRELARSESPITFTSHYQYMQRRSPSVEKLAHLVEWVPRTPLDNIIDDVLIWQRSLV